MAQPMPDPRDDPRMPDEPPGGWPEPPPDPAEEAYDEWLEGLLDWAEQQAVAWAEVGADDDPAMVLAQLAAGDTDLAGQLPERVAAGWLHIEDDADAERAMRRYARADVELGRLQAQADEWAAEATERLARIRAWFDHRAKRFLATQAAMEAHLVRYALDRRDADPKHAKTLVLPSGQVRTTEVKPKAAVADAHAVITWVCHQWADDPEVADEVAAPQERKLYVQKLRDRTTVVEVIDHARLVLASAELIDWWRFAYAMGAEDGTKRGPADSGAQPWHLGAEHQRCPQPGDGWPTPDEATDLVARVEVLASHLEVHGPDGLPVPGTHVEPGGVTAKVVPA